MRRKSYFFASVLHVAAFFVACYFGLIESSVLKYGPLQDQTFRKRVMDVPVGVGFSNYSENRLLSNCLNGLNAFDQKLATAPDKATFSGICKQYSKLIAEKSPFNSLAWTVAASSSQQIGDMVAMNTALVRAQRIAPNEQWLAIGRYQLAVDNVGSLSDEAKSAYDSDLALLAQSKFGVRAIAQRYVSNPDFREHIINIVSTLPEQTQKRFLNSVRAAVKNAN